MTDPPGGTDDRDREHTAPPHVAPPHAPETDAPALATRPGRWIDHWDPENEVQWETEGRAIARRNLRWSIFAEFLGFVVWQLWSIVAVTLPAAGFDLSTGEIFWLISIPSLVGRHAPHPVLVPRAEVRRTQLDDHLGRPAAPADDRARRLRVEPRDAVRRAARRGGPRRLRRRQLRQLDVEHHLLLPAEGEGLGARPQCRRRQPRGIRRAVRRADRDHDRCRRRR